MTSARVGQATLRSSPRTSRRNCGAEVRSLLGPGGRGRGALAGGGFAVRRPAGLAAGACASAVGSSPWTWRFLWRGKCRAGGTRTPNLRFWRPLLCQLSYCPWRWCGLIGLYCRRVRAARCWLRLASVRQRPSDPPGASEQVGEVELRHRPVEPVEHGEGEVDLAGVAGVHPAPGDDGVHEAEEGGLAVVLPGGGVVGGRDAGRLDGRRSSGRRGARSCAAASARSRLWVTK